MKATTAFVLASLLFAAGCASDVANRYYGETKYPARPVDQVQVLHNKPERSFVVLADFQSRGESAKDLQKKAAAIGADAVIVAYLGGRYKRSEEWAGDDSDKTYSRIVGTAIKFQ